MASLSQRHHEAACFGAMQLTHKWSNHRESWHRRQQSSLISNLNLAAPRRQVAAGAIAAKVEHLFVDLVVNTHGE